MDEFTTEQTLTGCDGYSVTVGNNTYTSTGIYTDVLTSVDGCDSIVITNLTIVDEFTTEQTLTGCDGYSVTVGNNTYTSTGIYTDVLTSVDGCDSTVITNLTIEDEIDVTVSVDGNIISANQTGLAYQWIDCSTGNELLGFTDASYTVEEDGNYAVIITSGNCSDTSECVSVVATSIEDDIQFQLNIYPNPATNYFIIEANSNLIESAALLNDLGQQVKTISLTNNISRVDVSDLPKGMYLVQIAFKNDGNMLFKKVIVD